MIRTAQVIDDSSAEDEIGVNNTVTIYVEDDDEEETFKLVTTVRGDTLHGLISVESPLGKAVLGHKVGDVVTVEVNKNYSYDVEIRKIEKTTDGDDAIRRF